MEEVVEEEFSVRKKNTPLLYNLFICHSLEWPSLTVQWLPSPPSSAAGDLVVHKLILGTHTSDDSPNFLMVADAYLPHDHSSTIAIDPEIIQKIQVDGEVNRARCMSQNQAIIVAKTSGTEVYVFDSTKQLANSERGLCDPYLRLRGHDKEGYGLSWSPFKEGYLLSGSNDYRICLWDTSATPQEKVLNAKYIYEGHESVVEDVSWHLKNENLFGSVGDDYKLMIWDLRTNKFQHSVVVHEREVNYLSFNPFSEYVLATPSSDSTVGLFDMCNLSSPLCSIVLTCDDEFGSKAKLDVLLRISLSERGSMASKDDGWKVVICRSGSLHMFRSRRVLKPVSPQKFMTVANAIDAAKECDVDLVEAKFIKDLEENLSIIRIKFGERS